MYDRVLYATHPGSVSGATQCDLRDRYLITDFFRCDAVTLTYVHQERLVVGGAMPVSQPVRLPRHDDPPSMKGQPFLAHREMAAVNISTAIGRVTVDGTPYDLAPNDALYIGSGACDVEFASPDLATPARFYLASTPAHRAIPTQHIAIRAANPLRRGSPETANARTIHQLVVPGVCESAQLLVGLTILDPGSVWNTMPPHLHDRRSEVYFYFDVEPQSRVFHFMGRPEQMRHIVVGNEQAVVCPPWSVHTGVGTSRYAFIWAMGGENLDYNDMNNLDICQLT
ncbi:5-dehydro-4-deoxy-D-glucuronate isomerase [Asticcacaulis sp. AC402]|uniref:5-dehydro-4-deoxy-D-glucuronate isomerase n=1 Tax=Asticcacaulis sp. AC402 TaxID=1282361 RepID=UPI0003C40ABB|nr:5-dehydro-4-deoxy-D-glucuronate isomerase [Asticcacaulis sp. AC402]ESQ74254.1 5-keto-4-deoxyuronate isomerase [Asticcacaulis sp. AC402]